MHVVPTQVLPGRQAGMQVVFRHMPETQAKPLGQPGAPQVAPQWVELFCKSKQPSAQQVSLPTQWLPPQLHMPPPHDSPRLQATAQLPQWLELVLGSTQVLSQQICPV